MVTIALAIEFCMVSTDLLFVIRRHLIFTKKPRSACSCYTVLFFPISQWSSQVLRATETRGSVNGVGVVSADSVNNIKLSGQNQITND